MTEIGVIPMILSASRRTDIPDYYSEWLARRFRAGFLCVRNPMNRRQVSRIALAPEVIDCIVFWTKNLAPMFPYLDEFSRYMYYFQFTLTGYGRESISGYDVDSPILCGRLEPGDRVTERKMTTLRQMQMTLEDCLD